MDTSDPLTTPLSIKDHLTRILPRLARVRERRAPLWPPDVFALVMSLIQASGIYTSVLNEWPPAPNSQASSENWAEKMRKRGASWREIAGEAKMRVPSFIERRWKILMDFIELPLIEIRQNRALAVALFEMAAMADEASAGVGLPKSPGGSATEVRFYRRARRALLPSEHLGSSLCREIDKTRVRVLPKMHAPNKGLTIRSLSHHLALCSAEEILPHWESSITYAANRQSMNLLVIPWPDVVRPVQFQRVFRRHTGMRNMPNEFGFFSYSPQLPPDEDLDAHLEEFVNKIEALYDEAKAMLGRVDGIVFPELALVPEQFEALRKQEFTRRAFLVSGIAGAAEEENGCNKNELYCDIPNTKRVVQSKHHRWKLDKGQIEQYGLGGLLSPERSWWEYIDVDNRKLKFVSLLPWLVLSVVICEDLARPDPVGDLLRAVGPNLVIALLMDGPQIKERWSARYATTLAEDPGCSVLSLTSIGMSKLSRPSSGANRNRIIGLWKDAHSSSPVEIELPEGCGGVVLSMSVRWMEEWTADGREDKGSTGYPILSGIHGVKNPVHS